MAKKKQPVKQVKLSPLEYIKTKARTLPIHKCYLNSDWQEIGMAFIIVVRAHTNGNFTFGGYLVDTFGLGLKNTFAKFNEKPEVLEDIIANFIPQEKEDFYTEITADYALVHNIIYGAIGFAEDHGFKPHKDFRYTQFILEEDDERIELIEIDFGIKGVPKIREEYGEE